MAEKSKHELETADHIIFCSQKATMNAHYCSVQDPPPKEWGHPHMAGLPISINVLKIVPTDRCRGPFPGDQILSHWQLILSLVL